MAELYLDASDHVLGRLASNVAKSLLKGNSVIIVNAEKVVVSGDHKATFDFFRAKIARGDPYHGPFYPQVPDKVVKRVVRGMLPKNHKGKTALKNLRVFISVPDELKGKKFERVKKAENNLNCKFVDLQEISRVVSGRKIGI